MKAEINKLETNLANILENFNDVLASYEIDLVVTQFMVSNRSDAANRNINKAFTETVSNAFIENTGNKEFGAGGCRICCNDVHCKMCCVA